MREETSSVDSETTDQAPDMAEIEQFYLQDPAAGQEENQEQTEPAEAGEEALSQPDDENADEATEPEPETVEEQPLSDLEYPKFKARVDKLTAQKIELRDKVEELEAQVEALRNAPAKEEPTETKNNQGRYSHLNTVEDIERERETAAAHLKWALENEGGAVVTMADGTEQDFDADMVNRIKVNSQMALAYELDKRKQEIAYQGEFLNARKQNDQAAAKAYAWYEDPNSDNYKEATRILKQFPALNSLSDAKMVIGDMLAGRKARMATKTAAPKIAPQQPGATARVAPTPRKARVQSAEDAFYKSGGGRDELAELFKAS